MVIAPHARVLVAEFPSCLRVLLRKFPRNSDTPRVRVRVVLSKLRVQQTQRHLIETMRLRFVMATNSRLAFRAYDSE